MQMQSEKMKLQQKQEDFFLDYQRQLEEITRKLDGERMQKENLQRRIQALEEAGLKEKEKIEVCLCCVAVKSQCRIAI
jgi:hypothetical protein